MGRTPAAVATPGSQVNGPAIRRCASTCSALASHASNESITEGCLSGTDYLGGRLHDVWHYMLEPRLRATQLACSLMTSVSLRFRLRFLVVGLSASASMLGQSPQSHDFLGRVAVSPQQPPPRGWWLFRCSAFSIVMCLRVAAAA